ncbi:MAG: hypothetical protein M1416_03255 [Candidatus Pacearchaeota archaeon]|nr:hypothetical protein [Candidatus Pacearchaeota archaeon]
MSLEIKSFSCVDGITFIGEKCADTTNHDEIRLKEYTALITKHLYRSQDFVGRMKDTYLESVRNPAFIIINKKNIVAEQYFYIEDKK